ncbi:MAG TPA: DUF3015 family protein [Gammaproteobacteria bacterium]|nr:DUF3015 family protein [Gammaproteobacteria bacterium]
MNRRMPLPVIVSLFAVLLALSGCSAVVSTTNAVADAAHQTTRMTSSTSDSFEDAGYRHRAKRFVDTDIDAIRRQAARGYGDELDALAVLLHEPNRAAFPRWMQAHYADLFSNLQKPAQLLDRIHRLQRKTEASDSA